MSDSIYPSRYFARQDERDDAYFYQMPRKVVHIDDSAIAAVQRVLAALLPPGGRYLDLMSSWRSHIPDELQPVQIIGLGMNAAEMAENHQLDGYVVHDLNSEPQLPFTDAEFDAAICTVSVQYLTRPIAVFQSVHRVLRPGAPFVVSFSNRCFAQKAVAIWLASTDEQHVQLVADYFAKSGGWSEPEAWENGEAQTAGDPLYAVWAHKAAAEK
jgi:SAM-dependent methyltransferase